MVFFAASRDQRKYFSELSQHLTMQGDIGSKVIWYKSLKRPCFFVKYPIQELWHQAQFLTIRKQNSRKGKNSPGFIWPIFTFISFIQACWLYAIYSAWLQKTPCEFIGIWNGKKFRQAVLVIAINAMNKKAIFFETGPLPGVSAIDPKGVNFYSSIPNEVSFYLNRTLSGNIEKTVQKSEITRPGNLPNNFILVPFQVVEDSNIYLHSQWIRHMRQLFAVCKSVSEQLDNKITFAFKEHPACDEQYDDLRAQQTPQLQFIDGFTTSELIEYSDAIITVNSTVGIEGLLARKKVFVLGDALFGIEGISFLASSEKDLLDYLQNLDGLELNEKAIASFIDYLTYDYAIPQNAMKEPGEPHWQAANKRLLLLLDGKVAKALNLQGKG